MVINISADGLAAWVRSKNITAHTIAVAAVAIATAITTDETVRSFLVGVFQQHPKIVSGVTGLAVIILKYGHSSSNAGVVANAQSILAAPNPPTEAAVQAAQTDPSLPGGPAKP